MLINNYLIVSNICQVEIYVECTLELPHQGNSNEYNQHMIIIWKIKKISLNTHFLLPDLASGLTLNELPISQTNFHGPKEV